MQSKRRSFIESTSITILGIGYAVPLNYVLLTKIQWSGIWVQSSCMALIFVVTSIIWKYHARRFFNWLDIKYPSL